MKTTEGYNTRLQLDMSFDQTLKRIAKVNTKELEESTIKKGEAAPFVKWVGGKRSIIQELITRLPETFNNYYEPFVGGGALFFSFTHTKNVFLSDMNIDLVITYGIVKKQPEELIDALRKHAKKHSPEYYYKIRARQHLKDSIQRAARLIYLNRTCYNGLYRTNKKGEFNVPIGRYDNPDIIREDVIRSCSKALTKVNIQLLDFKNITPKKGDFVYFDPPYHPRTGTSFTKYTINDFSEEDQTRLRDFCIELHKKGVYIMLSNSNTEFIRTLYKNKVFKVSIVHAPRNVNCKAAKRTSAEEVLITNYDYDGKTRRNSSK